MQVREEEKFHIQN